MTLSKAQNDMHASARQYRQERDRQAMALRLGGASLEQIAAQLHFRSVSGVHYSLERFMRNVPTDLKAVEAARALQLARLERLHMAWWTRAIGANADPAALNAVLRISDRITRLLGLEREPLIDFEARLRQAAEAEGLDPDVAVREAEAIIRKYEPLWKRR